MEAAPVAHLPTRYLKLRYLKNPVFKWVGK